ncbi:NIPA-like protein 3 [Phytophthora boehmeriae]|uniref:NIPA-like protein 3 n=1 Tax=Phytophthora boehmeriae TaxID=109152 RepID=A0A8T1VIZ4_9STRA|nr:NIPA-like protein 3 [Phytophthora boehmeriae]
MTGVTRFLSAAMAGEDDNDNVQGKWIGLGIVIGSAVLSNLGVNVQKLSHVQEDERPIFERRTYYTRPMWLVGLILIALGAIGDFEALGFAPQSLVAAVGGGFTVLANVFFAHLWLGQILTRTDVLGTLLIIIGVVLSTVANEPDQQMSLVELEKQFFQLGFLVYLGVMTAILAGLFGQVEAILRLPRAMNEAKYRLLPFMYATASGIFGSFSVLLAKCASILLILTVSGENQFVYFTTYLFMGGMMCTLVLQTDLLNRAIMAGDTLSVFPMFQCFWIGSSVVGGVVFYEKYTRFSVFDWICLPIALAFIIAGIYLLAKHGEDDLDNPDDAEHPTPGHRAHLTGHFGALMPLSPQGHAYRSFSHKSFDDRDNEHTPLRYTPKNGQVIDRNGNATGHHIDYNTNFKLGHPKDPWHGHHNRRHQSLDLEQQRLYSGSV